MSPSKSNDTQRVLLARMEEQLETLNASIAEIRDHLNQHPFKLYEKQFKDIEEMNKIQNEKIEEHGKSILKINVAYGTIIILLEIVLNMWSSLHR